MTIEHTFSNARQVVPRWHTYPVARWMGIALSAEAAEPDPASFQDFSEKVLIWKSERTSLYAADLVGSALVLNRFDSKEAIEAAVFITSSINDVSGPLLELAQTYLSEAHKRPLQLPNIILPEHTTRFHEAIRQLKTRVREYPRNPILWMDLAYYYSTVGQIHAAEKAVLVALSLNTENSYLLRSGSRFFMHVGHPDRGLELIRRSEMSKHDPWLMAAEIAIADTLGFPPKRIKNGQEALGSSRIPKFHLSELASALGTIEFANGAVKKGRRLFKLALEDPTENTLAQAAYLSDILGCTASNIDPKWFANSFEAEARLMFYHNEDYDGALEAAKKWFAYQPFSASPAVSGSYIASVALEDHEDAVRIIKMGLLSSPKNVILRNNMAFALASLDRPSEAKESICSLSDYELSDSELNIVTAARALIEFRNGNPDAGRKLYEKSILGFKQSNNIRAETMARFFFLREEMTYRPETTRPALLDVLKEAKRLDIKELTFNMKRSKILEDVSF